MSIPLTRNNHYVPEWYQKGFHPPGESKLQYLDLHPEEKVLPDGKVVSMRALNLRGPKKCFCEYDLYSIHFGEEVVDVIERRLFGSIDVRGAKAVRAFVGGDLSGMHDAFQDFFEYMDAQKLRTPKGLAWIATRYGTLDQRHLMVEMQELQFMHCTMWTEGVREIVSAVDSEVKFIVSDHPVTLYNAAVPPGAPQCQYPGEPPLEWMGTQTVFVLDPDTCLILTHLEYANNPERILVTAPRTNARYRGGGLVRTDAFIRNRRLKSNEVTAVNYLLKSRARRYVAAAREPWLFPERTFVGNWQDIGEVLRPRDRLYELGGELIVGYKDGSSHYQDEFGRTSNAHKYLRKELTKNITTNDRCGCGSGRKFKRCCEGIPEAERPTWKVYSIRERNLMFCNKVKHVLGLKNGKSWTDVRRELSDEQVKEIHSAYASLWPEDTDLSELLPRPRSDTFRAVYLGQVDPRSIGATVLGWLPVFDEILVASPFMNPIRVRDEYSPSKTPSKSKYQTLKNVFLLLQLEPFILNGKVHMVPDPSDFDPHYGRSAMRAAERLSEGIQMPAKVGGFIRILLEDDHRRFMRALSDEEWVRRLRESDPGISEKLLAACLRSNKETREADPFALLQDLPPGEAGAQFLVNKGYSLGTAMFLASLTGSVLFTDVDVHWQQIQRQVVGGNHKPQAQVALLIRDVLPIPFNIDIDSRLLEQRLEEGRFGALNAAFREVADAVKEPTSTSRSEYLVAQLASTAKLTETLKPKGEEERVHFVGRIEISAPTGGFTSIEVKRLLLTFGKAAALRPLPFAMRIIFDQLDELGEPDEGSLSA